MTKPNVVLLHGVLMNAVEMLYLKHQLEKQGFTVHSLSYQSVKYSIQHNTRNLYERIKTLSCSEFHIVAHSLGGVMAMHLLHQHPDLPIKRIVMLGTPISGSYTAKKISRWKIVGLLLKQSMYQGLEGNCNFSDSSKHDIGMIAGSIRSPIGFGLLLGKLPDDNDGTVLISETKHPAISQHIIVNKSHTGLIFSPMISSFVADYLRTGQFST